MAGDSRHGREGWTTGHPFAWRRDGQRAPPRTPPLWRRQRPAAAAAAAVGVSGEAAVEVSGAAVVDTLCVTARSASGSGCGAHKEG